ncbi:MAG: T9SS type A sorting domain-containing protein [Lentimicrobiaceae bacterium]|jgi:hypothetical protein|nr:T9SS type A sorting domain-containing protein [Lentimicrobiaceae bacterium]
MKQIVLIFSVILFYLSSFAQQGFVFTHESEKSVMTMDVVETADGDFLLLNRLRTNELSFLEDTRIVKISKEGFLLDEISLNFQDSIAIITDLIPNPDNPNYYLALGIVGVNNNICNRLMVAQIDADLQIISRHTIAIPQIETISGFIRFIVHSENNIVVASNSGAQANLSPSFCARITVHGELKKMVFNNANKRSFLGAFFVLDDGANPRYGLMQSVTASSGGVALGVYEIDSNLNSSFLTEIPNFHEGETGEDYHAIGFYPYEQTVKPFLNETLLISLQVSESWGLSINDRSTMVFQVEKDFVFNKDKSIIFTNKNDTVEFPATFQSIDFIDPNQVFHAFSSNMFPQYMPCQSFPSYFVISKLNSDLEVQWTRYVGGDAFYYSMYLLATKDGGCVVVGSRYNYNYQCKHDMFVIKLNSEGLIGLDEEPELVQEMVAYPNPFHDRVQLLLPPNTCRVSVYNSNGMLIKTGNGNCNELFLGDVPAGLYIVTAQTAEGKVYIQKVVKE